MHSTHSQNLIHIYSYRSSKIIMYYVGFCMPVTTGPVFPPLSRFHAAAPSEAALSAFDFSCPIVGVQVDDWNSLDLLGVMRSRAIIW